MNKTEQLRRLPSVDQVLRDPSLQDLLDKVPHRSIAQWIRQAIDRLREQILEDASSPIDDLRHEVIDRVQRFYEADRGQSVRRVINATGVVLHTNLGRAPLAAAAIKRVSEAVKYANVELDLQSGRRSKRGQRVADKIAELVGAEDAVMVNNCAAATLLVLQATAAGREVIVSRGQLVEIGGGFRLPDVFRSAGVQLREVGTTNRTYVADYQSAISEQSGAIIRVHRSNFQLTGFVTEPTIDELVSLRRPEEIPVIDDLGSGCMEDLADVGLREPTVPESVAAGADLTLFSGDKLFGGPQCGIVVGRSRWIEKLKSSPMMRAMRIDKMTLAAMEATVEIHAAQTARTELPVLRMLTESPDVVKARCERVIDRFPSATMLQIVACESPVGGGSVPGAVRESFAIKLTGDHLDAVATRLRSGEPAVQARLTDSSLMFDMRTVADDEVECFTERLQHAVSTSPKGRQG